MQLSRRKFLGGIAGASLASLPSLQAFAKSGGNYPDTTIKMTVPFSPGSNTDIAGRIWAEIIGGHLGQSVVIENRPGAGGNIGASAVARATADGYNLLYSTATTYAINPFIYPSLTYEPIKDFTTVGVTISVPVVLVVSGQSDIKNYEDLKRSINENPQKHSYGSNGAGTSSHIACKVIADLLGQSELLHVPYRSGSQQVMSDVISGVLTYAVDAWSVVGPLVKAGRLRAIAVTSGERLSVAPDTPTLSELSGKDTVIVTWNALWAPTGTPDAILDKLHNALSEGRKDPALSQRFESQGTPLLPEMSRQECEQFMHSEVQRWKGFIDSANVKL